MARWKQTPRGDLPLRGAGVLRAAPTSCARSSTGFCSTSQDGETRKSILRQHQRRAIDAIVARCADPDQDARPGLAHAGLGQDLHAADGRAADPGGQGALRERDRDPGRRPHRARGPAQGLGRAAARRNAAARTSPSGGPTPRPSCRQLLDADFRGLIISMIHKFEAIRKDSCTARQHLRVHRRGAPLGRQGPRHLPDGGGAERDDHRLHRHADRRDGAGRRHVQDLRRGGRAGLPRQVLDRRIDRGRDHAADQARHGAERDDGAGRAAGQGVLRARRSRRRHRHRGAEQGARPRGGPAHLPDGR